MVSFQMDHLVHAYLDLIIWRFNNIIFGYLKKNDYGTSN